MMIQLFAITLWIGVSSGQLKVNDQPSITADQREVLPLLEEAQAAVLKRDATRLIRLFESTGTRLTNQEVRDINAMERRIEDPTDLFSCIIFDSLCARAYLKKNPDAAAQEIGRVFISVREFLEKHAGLLQVTFHETPRDEVLAEIHIPRRPDSATVPPPLGVYESLSLRFIRTRSGWKINSLFPELFVIVLQLR